MNVHPHAAAAGGLHVRPQFVELVSARDRTLTSMDFWLVRWAVESGMLG